MDPAAENVNQAVADAVVLQPSKWLFCSEHGMGVSSSAQLFDVTGHASIAQASDEAKLVKEAEHLSADTLENALYRISFSGFSKTHVAMQKVSSQASEPVASFRIPVFYGFGLGSTTIAFSPPASSGIDSSNHQQTIEVKMNGKVYTREQVFVYNSCTYVWKVDRGTHLRLIAKSTGREETLAKFYFTARWFASGGVLVLGQAPQLESDDERFEIAIVASLMVCLRREREIRYNIAGHFVPLKRSWV